MRHKIQKYFIQSQNIVVVSNWFSRHSFLVNRCKNGSNFNQNIVYLTFK